jgi:putative Holliday junction resolvase
MSESKRMMGVDYGDVRTGLALSDITGMLSSAYCTLKEGGMRNTAKRVAEEAEKNGVCRIVVGLPKNMDGSEGPRAQVVLAFVDILKEYTTLPIEMYDERLSTVLSHRMLSMTGVGGKKRKDVVDALSAEIILQNYMDKHR